MLVVPKVRGEHVRPHQEDDLLVLRREDAQPVESFLHAPRSARVLPVIIEEHVPYMAGRRKVELPTGSDVAALPTHHQVLVQVPALRVDPACTSKRTGRVQEPALLTLGVAPGASLQNLIANVFPRDGLLGKLLRRLPQVDRALRGTQDPVDPVSFLRVRRAAVGSFVLAERRIRRGGWRLRNPLSYNSC